MACQRVMDGEQGVPDIGIKHASNNRVHGTHINELARIRLTKKERCIDIYGGICAN